MNNLTVSSVDLTASIDADDVIRGLKNNDESILSFILQMLDYAGSSDLEAELVLRVKERLGLDQADAPVLKLAEGTVA